MERGNRFHLKTGRCEEVGSGCFGVKRQVGSLMNLLAMVELCCGKNLGKHIIFSASGTVHAWQDSASRVPSDKH
eukprot:747285-Hanusia_phi.AAC.8